MGLPSAVASPQERSFLKLFDTIRSGFIARMQPIPRATDNDLRKLDMQMLVVLGDRDAVFDSQETERRILATAGAAEVVMLRDTGHGIANPTPLVRKFLSAV